VEHDHSQRQTGEGRPQTGDSADDSQQRDRQRPHVEVGDRVGGAEEQQALGQATDREEGKAEKGEAPLLESAPPPVAGEQHREGSDQEDAEQREQGEKARIAQQRDRVAPATFARGFDRPFDLFRAVLQPRYFGEVVPLRFGRAAQADFAIAVDDGLQRAPVVDFHDAAELPLDEAISGRVAIALIGGPGAEEDDADAGGDAEPAPAGHAAQSREQQQRDDPEDARAVGEHRQGTERGEQRGDT